MGMTVINKYFLDYDKTYQYFVDHIICDRTLDKKIMSRINFKEGSFFTFLPDYAFLERLYDLKSGILPSYQIDIKGWQVVSKGWEIEDFVAEHLKQNQSNVVVLDQYIPELSDLKEEGVDVVFCNSDAHYLIRSSAPLKSIKNAIEDTDHGWHMLVVLTRGVKFKEEGFDENDFDVICKNVKYIVTTCYDGEGYLFWEKT